MLVLALAAVAKMTTLQFILITLEIGNMRLVLPLFVRPGLWAGFLGGKYASQLLPLPKQQLHLGQHPESYPLISNP